MMHEQIVSQLRANSGVFLAMLGNVDNRLQRWRPQDGKWCLLEVVCHLLDEEKEDFRARTRLALNRGHGILNSINPVDWVKERDYYGQDYPAKLQAFLEERERSLSWLESLENPDWSAAFEHKQLGRMTAFKMLANWLAHDYHHIRQINRIKYSWLKQHSGEDLSYAGDWSA